MHRETLKRSSQEMRLLPLRAKQYFFRGRILYAEHTYLHTSYTYPVPGKTKERVREGGEKRKLGSCYRLEKCRWHARGKRNADETRLLFLPRVNKKIVSLRSIS